MKDQKLREALEELNLKLLELSPAEEPLQAKRDALAAHIQEALEQEDLGGFHFSLAENLNEAIVAFEDSHPKLAHLMSGVIKILDSIGI